jgi:hypothetical protein
VNKEMKNKPLRKYGCFISMFIIVALIFSGCIDDNTISYHFSFEENMNGWISDGTDLSNPEINWSIQPSNEMSVDGNKSMKFYLENLNDAGKIWIERIFQLDPNTKYIIRLSFRFATRDFGNVNLFRIIAGMSIKNPETYNDLIFQDYTGNQQDHDVGFVWMNKSYSLSLKTNETGIVYGMIGVWGTWETARTYYVDSVNISFSKLSYD